MKSFKIKKSVLGRVAALGASSFLTQFSIVVITVINNILLVKYGAASAYGAKKYDRVRKLLGLMFWWTAAVCVLCTVLFEGVPRFFIRMFGADGELYTQFAVRCLRIYLSLILFTCVQKVCAIFLQSIGYVKAAVPLSILRDVLLIAFSRIAPGFRGVESIFWAAPVADFIAISITGIVMVRVWKALKNEESETDKAWEKHSKVA